MARTSTGFRILTVVVALALTAFSVGFTWTVVDDYSRRDIVPKGATVEGVPVGGLPREEAERVVREKVEKLLLAPLGVSFRGKHYAFEASKYLSVDVEGMVDETFKPQQEATLPERVVRRITDDSVSINVARKLKVDEAGVRQWVDETAKTIDLKPVDSKLTVKKDRLNISKASVGYKLDREANVAILSKALRDGNRDVQLKIDTVKPKIDEKSFGKSILVVKSERHLYLYDGPKLEKDYDCAIGTPGHPTPAGWWVIENKRYRPTWTNPAPNGWGAGMPAYIGPGYSNPLGTRALDLNASGIRIHGSSNNGSIGTAASHGCMRMHMWDIEDLYERVEVGTRVIIIP